MATTTTTTTMVTSTDAPSGSEVLEGEKKMTSEWKWANLCDCQFLNDTREICDNGEGMQVLILGMPRTGTTSIRVALRILGYGRHYYWDTMSHQARRDAPKWVRLLQRKYNGGPPITRADFDDIFGTRYASCADWPCSALSEELVQAYPEAKFILTTRDSAEAWCKSFGDTVWHYHRRKCFPQTLSERFWALFAKRHTPVARVSDLILQNTPMKDFDTQGAQWYQDHNQMVRDLVPKDRLLEFNAKQGWQPLCDFLGQELPDFPYPSTNGTEKFRTGVDDRWRIFQLRKTHGFLRIFSTSMLFCVLLSTLLGSLFNEHDLRTLMTWSG